MYIDKWMDQDSVVHRYKEYYTSIKKNEIMLFVATWTELKITILSNVSHTQKDKYHMIYMEYKKWYKLTYLKNGNWFRDLENKFMFITSERGRGGTN